VYPGEDPFLVLQSSFFYSVLMISPKPIPFFIVKVILIFMKNSIINIRSSRRSRNQIHFTPTQIHWRCDESIVIPNCIR